MSPVRTASPVLGSDTKTVRRSAMICGFVQVFPPSVDLMKATLKAVTLKGGVIRSKKSYSVPVWGSTTIWFAIVCCRDGVLTMIRGGLQVRPPSMVFEKNVGPLKAAVCRSAYGLPFGSSSRSHTA